MQKLNIFIVILLAGSLRLPAQQDYTYVVDEEFIHYENIYKGVEGLLIEGDQYIVGAQFHISSGHFSMIRLFADGTYDGSFGFMNSNGGGGGHFTGCQMDICVSIGLH